MLDFSKLLSSEYLFQINSITITRSDKLFAALGVAFVILAILFKLASIFSPIPLDKQVRNRFYRLFLTIGLLEVVWYAARYQNIRFFGSHFVALIMLLIGLIWFGFIVTWIWKNYRKEKVEWEKQQVKLKYLAK